MIAAPPTFKTKSLLIFSRWSWNPTFDFDVETWFFRFFGFIFDDIDSGWWGEKFEREPTQEKDSFFPPGGILVNKRRTKLILAKKLFLNARVLDLRSELVHCFLLVLAFGLTSGRHRRGRGGRNVRSWPPGLVSPARSAP